MSAEGLRARIRDHALALPEAWQDHPWGESVVKVRARIFLFLGMEPPSRWPVSVTLKLPGSHPMALAQQGVEPSGYGLGRAGWVTVDLSTARLPFEALCEWIDESYRAVAPKKLSALLDMPPLVQDHAGARPRPSGVT